VNMSVTRGHGILEEFLARQRSRMADRLIPDSHRKERLLDIGCGSYPAFLANTAFSEKVGIDKSLHEDCNRWLSQSPRPVTLVDWDMEIETTLPFDSESFSIVTMLAVFEHIESTTLVRLLMEIYRVLRPGGMFIMTTPAAWTDPLLKTMAKVGLISSIEINEHKDAYSLRRIAATLEQAQFRRANLRSGYFELFMNTWVTATK
jgi:SAM-dependent methyltransferase